MDDREVILANGIVPNKDDNKGRTGDSIKMNGSLNQISIPSNEVATDVSTIDSPDRSSSSETSGVINITQIGFDLEQLFALSLKFFKSEFFVIDRTPFSFSSIDLSKIMKGKHFMHLMMIVINLLL